MERVPVADDSKYKCYLTRPSPVFATQPEKVILWKNSKNVELWQIKPKKRDYLQVSSKDVLIISRFYHILPLIGV